MNSIFALVPRAKKLLPLLSQAAPQLLVAAQMSSGFLYGNTELTTSRITIAAQLAVTYRRTETKDYS